MNITRIYNDADGESRFEELAMPTTEQPAGITSPILAVEKLFVRESPGGGDQDWHRAPRRVLVIPLAGEVEVEVSSGEVRKFAPGDLLLAEDLEGKGHRTRTLTADPRKTLFVTLGEGALGAPE